MARKKALPTRRGRAARDAEAAAGEAGDAAVEAQEAADDAAESAAEASEAKASGGLEMALIVVTFVALVAAFALLQYEMRHAFGEGWPV